MQSRYQSVKVALIVAACACAINGAQAQDTSSGTSSVTIYGLVDTAVEHLSNVNGSHLTRMPTLSGSLPSRIGFRGTEDLGGGLRAFFVLESGFGPDTGTLNQGNRVWGRGAYVGLGGQWGTLSLGRQYTMIGTALAGIEILGPGSLGLAAIDPYYPNARADNSIAYKGTFGGLTAGATYSLGRDNSAQPTAAPAGSNCAGETAGDSKACREYSFVLRYEQADWGVAAARDRIYGSNLLAPTLPYGGLTSSKITDTRSIVSGFVKAAGARIGGGWVHHVNYGTPATPTSNVLFLGATYPFNVYEVEASAYRLKYENSVNRTHLYYVRGWIHLSKRTDVYATLARADNRGLSTGVSGGQAGGLPPIGGSQNGVIVGMRHFF